MKEIVILSGKGGTGKTTITAAFASLAARAVLVDCDVDAADLHLILAPEVLETHEFFGGKKASIRPYLCAGGGDCLERCRFGAVIETGDGEAPYRIDPVACEGCGVCARFCPTGAIRFREVRGGEWYRSRTRFGVMIHARLAPAEENSGKLVSLIRREARASAGELGADLILADGPPGAGCPVIASVTGADYVVIVTEPTVSGIHDLKRVCELTRHFRIPAGVVINREDLNPRMADEIEAFATPEGIPILGRIPYDGDAVKAQMKGLAVTELPRSRLKRHLERVWTNVTGALGERRSAFEILHAN